MGTVPVCFSCGSITATCPRLSEVKNLTNPIQDDISSRNVSAQHLRHIIANDSVLSHRNGGNAEDNLVNDGDADVPTHRSRHLC